MDLLTAYKHYLFTQKSKASPATVKNYLADISRFLRWFEAAYNQPFSSQNFPPDIIIRYKSASIASSASTPDLSNNLSKISERSFARHSASLRKFFEFLRDTYSITNDPFMVPRPTRAPSNDDRWHITDYKNFLYNQKSSHHTIKNYITDVKQYLAWIETVTTPQTPWELQGSAVFECITSTTLSEYRQRLLTDAHLSPLSINRKLSSLRKYVTWLADTGYLLNTLSLDLAKLSNVNVDMLGSNDMGLMLSLQDNQDYYTEKSVEPSLTRIYSRFPPLRLMQKVGYGIGVLLDLGFINQIVKAAEAIQFLLFRLTGKSVFASLTTIGKKGAPAGVATVIDTAIMQSMAAGQSTATVIQAAPSVKNFAKTFYAPLSVSTMGMPVLKKLLFQLRYYRPEWYKKYHTYPVVHYIHFGILIFYVLGLIGGGYYISVHASNYQLPVLASSQVDPPKLLSFSGSLTAEHNSPLTATSTLRFSLYNSTAASGAALLWQEVRNVTPDNNGKFSLTLGQRVPIPANLLVENPNLFLGISVGNTAEMRPREQIATAGLASTSQSIDGLKPITTTGETRNTLLALNSAGNLAIGGSGTTFQATEGLFTLSGEALLLTTNPGSDGNVTIAPDGQGFIDLQSGIVNSLENNHLSTAPGAVEVDDTFAVLASSSAVAALTIEQDGTAPFISASSGGTAKFSLDYIGNGYFSGNLALGGSSLTTNSSSFTLFPDNAINLNIGNSSTALSLGATSGTTTVRNNLQINGNTNLGDSTGDVITVAGRIQPANNSIQDLGSTATAFNNAYLTNLFLTPTATMSGFLRRDSGAVSLSNTSDSLILGSSNLSSALIRLSGASGQDSYINSGKLGLGTSSTLTDQLQVYGDIRVGTSTTDGCLKRYDGTAIAGTCSSDRRFKKNIQPITDILGKLDQVQPVTYNMRTDEFPQYGFGSGTSYGLIAQDLEKVFPDLVETDSNGYKMVKYGPELTMISLEGIKELNSKVDQIKNNLLAMNQNLPLSPSGDIIFSNVHNDEYAGQTMDGTLLSATAAYFKVFSANISAGLVHAKQGAFDTLAVTTENFSIAGKTLQEYILQTIENNPNGIKNNTNIASPTIATNLISPLASDSELSISIQNSAFIIHNSKNASGSAVATIDREGNASFSGQLTANGVTTTDASISGTLRAGRIIAANIDGLDDKIATLAAQQNATASANQNITNVYNIYNNASESGSLSNAAGSRYQVASSSATPAIASIHNTGYMLPATNYMDIASISAALAYVPNLNTDFTTINQGLMVFGPTSLADVSVADQLSIGGKLILADNTINVLGATLEIQPLRQGNISLMGGLVTINTQGDVSFNGSAIFAKNVRVNGELAVNILAPVPDKDLIIKLGSESKQNETSNGSLPIHNSSLIIHNSSNSAVLAINSLGDLIASGTATLGSLNIVRGASADTSAIDTVASGSAGVATITAGYTSRTIYSPFVGKDALIYITPRSQTTVAVPYLARQTEEDKSTGTKASFTVQIPGPVTQEVSFNWWIVN